jgi:hypothetical protein
MKRKTQIVIPVKVFVEELDHIMIFCYLEIEQVNNIIVA